MKTKHGSLDDEVLDSFTYAVKKLSRGRNPDIKWTAENPFWLQMSGFDGFNITKWTNKRLLYASLILRTIAATSSSRNPKMCSCCIICPWKHQLSSFLNFRINIILKILPCVPLVFSTSYWRGWRLEAFGYAVMKVMADINWDIKMFQGVLGYVSLWPFFNKFSCKFPGSFRFQMVTTDFVVPYLTKSFIKRTPN